MLKKIVLDLETQKSFQDVGGRGKNHLLKVSVCVIYDYSTDKYTAYEEHELGKLSPILQTADQIIGYNIKDFDFQVIQPYLNFNISEVPALDLLEEIEKVLNHRIKLEVVAQGTLGSGKSGSGLEAAVVLLQLLVLMLLLLLLLPPPSPPLLLLVLPRAPWR